MYYEIMSLEQYLAYRSGNGSRYSWGNEWPPSGPVANLSDESREKYYPTVPHIDCDDGYVGLSPVWAFPSNYFGLLDMSGNVMEFTGTNHVGSDGLVNILSVWEVGYSYATAFEPKYEPSPATNMFFYFSKFDNAWDHGFRIVLRGDASSQGGIGPSIPSINHQGEASACINKAIECYRRTAEIEMPIYRDYLRQGKAASQSLMIHMGEMMQNENYEKVAMEGQVYARSALEYAVKLQERGLLGVDIVNQFREYDEIMTRNADFFSSKTPVSVLEKWFNDNSSAKKLPLVLLKALEAIK